MDIKEIAKEVFFGKGALKDLDTIVQITFPTYGIGMQTYKFAKKKEWKYKI